VLLSVNFITAQQGVPFMNQNDIVNDPASPSSPSSPQTNCNSTGIGCPYDNEPIKYVKVNIHYYLNANGTGGFNEQNDGGTPPYPYNGYQRAEDMIKEANKQLETNGSIFGPNPTNSPSCKIPIRIVLGGVYFHRISNKGFCAWNFPFDTWNNNAVNSSSEININVTTYNKNCPAVAGIDPNDHGPSGVTQFGSNKMGMFNDWEMYQYETRPTIGTSAVANYPLMINAKTILHELFHTTGLDHPFEGDGCDDTYKFPKNCWGLDVTPPIDPACDTWGKISNNIMDYNEFRDWSLTPCQICTIYESFNGRGTYKQDKFVKQTGGCAPGNAFFDIPTDICLDSKFDKVWLQGSASFNEVGYTIEINEIDPNDPTGNLTNYFNHQYNGEVGKVDLRSLGYKFQVGKSYKVRLKVKDACGQFSNEVEKTIKIKNCGTGTTVEDEVPIDFESLSFFPNPTLGTLNLSYGVIRENINVNCDLHSTLTGEKLRILIDNEPRSVGDYMDTFELDDLQSGNYTLRFYTEHEYRVKQITINTF
jgi:hypothetical protein